MQETYIRHSPCERCGACCAFFRVSVPTAETNDAAGGLVPADMIFFSNSSQRCMKGTETTSPRCIALEGNVGVRVKCTIYENRPSTCRNFSLSWEHNIGNRLCDKARGVFGLQAFSQY
ncbi:MAG: YkgJ family cysteine cluster protein [Proteobacteria bacterium]|nr:YkgJ family cysteine cluster protein [Desulfobacula sp.]MBU3952085.1 YkgJ family cysteine cluster protein [Pseudomonadota bacterium]MBU4133011.1 YkgJ family cysteine cluster protein [Pseudomonadota bacterium]